MSLNEDYPIELSVDINMDTRSPSTRPMFDLTTGALLQSAEDVMNRIQTSIKNLLESVTVEQATFDNAIRPLPDIDNDIK